MNIELLPSQGTILPQGHIVPRKPVKVIKTDNGHYYQCALKSLGKEPVIRCQATGKVWHPTWPEMLDMAISSGIAVAHPDPDQPEEDPQ